MSSSANVKHQYLAAISANILSISYGCVYGWPSSSYLELHAEPSPLETGPLSKAQLGSITAAIFPGSLFGAIFFGWLADKIGRKRCMLVTAIPLLIHWLIVPLARNPTQLCVARFLAGAAGGCCFTVIPIYITELAEDRLRITLGTFLTLSLNVGILGINILAYYFHYTTVAWIMFALPLIFVALFVLKPESPQYLALHNNRKAEKSLRYYRGIDTNDNLNEKFQQELTKLCKTAQTNEIDGKTTNNSLNWADFTHRKARKAYLIGLGLVLANQLSGCLAMLNYMTAIFKDAGSSLPPLVSAIVVSFIQLMGTYLSTLFVERAGRKTLLLISTTGICLGECAMASYYLMTNWGYETSSFSWVPIAAFSLILFAGACGLLSVGFPTIAEITPPKIRSVIMRVQMSTMFILATCMVKLFPLLTESLGIPGTVFMFAGFSFVLTLFIAIFVPETKGKSIEAIQDSL